ncbi:MAG: single-stranded-DNA-specific exonuclease RecJ [Candidatus Cloacimonetes bacterium]|nr:single-stranded-DNA-specific exonuclease RecJ [Candidatus Cloacimonadota bacterium]
MEKKWEFEQKLTPELKAIRKLIRTQLKCPVLVADLLVRKGLYTVEEIEEFFNPSPTGIHDPFLFKDMEKAVERILRAIDSKEKITIYGDYDVDGTTATSLLYLGLKRLDGIVDFYIPHRMIDGYGLSSAGLQQIQQDGTSLIITVDCGINALDEVDMINQLGMEVIITDHHNPKDILPNGYAIINPKVPDCGYPFKQLAGVGVAYKLLMAIYTKLGIDSSDNINKYLDLVALGTVADIVPLIGENRIFASMGLKHLENKNNYGLNALIDIANLNDKTINTSNIVFVLAPRINAAGRMGSAAISVELLISNEEKRSYELAEIIEQQNSLRQQADQKTYQEACDIISQKYKDLDNTPCIIVSSDGWHPGVIGVVASKLVERFYRPVIMISFKDGLGSGSGRSIASFDLFAAITAVENNLYSFGGHKYAVGLTLGQESLDKFELDLSKFVQHNLDLNSLIQTIEIDRTIELYDINLGLLDWIEKFSPFGPDNMRPVFCTKDVTISSYPYTVGRNHLKMKVIKDGVTLDIIGYNLGHMLDKLRKNSVIDIVYTFEINNFFGKKSIQGKLKDLRIH